MGDTKKRIIEHTHNAMKARDRVRLGCLRLIASEFKRQEVDSRTELTEEQSIATLHKMVKQRRDSIGAFEKANRQDLVAIEQAELAIITEFLPAQLTAEALRALVQKAIGDTDAQSIKDMGKVMGYLQAPCTGRADMQAVSKLVKSALNTPA